MSIQSRVLGNPTVAALILYFLASIFCQVAVAQVDLGADQGFAYRPKISVDPLGPENLGGMVNAYNGAVKFYYTDIDLKGNSKLPVSFARSFQVGVGLNGANGWNIELPSIGGVFPSSQGWQVSTPGRPNDRCSVDDSNYMEATPPIAYGRTGGALPAEFAFSSAEYWYGNSLHIPGQPDQDLLVLTSENNSLDFDPAYKWITSGNWVFSCLPGTANSAVGEAFLARSPDGTSYRFDWLAASYSPSAQQLRKYVSVGAGSWLSLLDRALYRLLPTEISDGNGNWVKYSYDAAHPDRLISITANDGRAISVTYDSVGRLSTASAGNRIWRYQYDSSGLTKVILPDQSSWQYSFPPNMEVQYGLAPITCADPPQPNSGSWNAYVIAPSGLRGDYTFEVVSLGTSYVPRVCDTEDGGYLHLKRYKDEASVALVKRTLSGPGLPEPLTWEYGYGPLNSSYTDAPGTGQCVSAGCPETRVVTVTGPDSDWKIMTFGNRDDVDEGMLLTEETGEGPNSLKQVTNSYVRGTQEFPAVYGRIPCYRCLKMSERFYPLQSKVVDEAGERFEYKVNHFDSLARPIEVEKFSSSLSGG
jgi:hypothetical protein